MTYRYFFVIFILFMLYSPAYFAAENFSSSGVSLLYGTNYKIPMIEGNQDRKRYVITLDTINQWSWGDAFGFLDITRSTESSNATSIYGEFIPRVNFPEHMQPKSGLFERFLFAPSIEYGASANGFTQLNYLYGIGTNLNFPFFEVFQLNFFKRNNQRQNNNWQITPVWLAPFSVGRFDYVFSGWLDFTTATRGVPTSLHSQSQYMLDVGKFLFEKKQILYLGTELKIWKNKFLIRGINEKVLQALVMVRI